MIFLVHKIHKLIGAGKNFKRSHFLDEVNPERLSDLPVVKEQAYEGILSYLLFSLSTIFPQYAMMSPVAKFPRQGQILTCICLFLCVVCVKSAYLKVLSHL